MDSSLLNKYSLVKGAARRARQLQNGAPPTIVTKSMKACRVAQDEIQQGQVSYRLRAMLGAVQSPLPAAADEAES